LHLRPTQGIVHRAERQLDTADDLVFLHRAQHDAALPTSEKTPVQYWQASASESGASPPDAPPSIASGKSWTNCSTHLAA
jgi:hypothetical protein